MRRILALLLAAAMSLSLLVVASASEETVTLNTSYTVQGSLLTCTFTLDTGDTKGVGALSFYVKTTGLTFKPWNTEANKPIVQYGDMLPPTFKPGKTGVTDGYYSFTNGNGKDSRGYFIAAGGDPREGDSQRLLKGSSVLIFKATYTIDSSDYTLVTEDFKACLDGKQAELEKTRYNCVAPASVDKTPPTGVTVSGTITSYGSAGDTVTVELFKTGETTAAYTATGASYSIPNVASGTYTLEVSKKGHAPWTEEITVASSDISKNITIYPVGDVSRDGVTNSWDASLILQAEVGIITLDAYQKVIGDVSGDKSTNSWDASLILQKEVGLISVFPAE